MDKQYGIAKSLLNTLLCGTSDVYHKSTINLDSQVRLDEGESLTEAD